MSKISRRDFIKSVLKQSATVTAIAKLGELSSIADGYTEEGEILHEAMYYEKLPDLGVRCVLEPRQCDVNEGERGYCGTRENRNGKYYTLVHSQPCSVYADTVEQHHFYHFLPGQKALAIGTAGCNLQCKFCETWPVSQARPEEVESQYLPPEAVTEMAKKENCRAIIFAYNEPTAYYEYMLAIAKSAKKAGIFTAAQTAGYIYPEPLKDVCKYLDAVNIDLKGFTDVFYQNNCCPGVELEHVLTSIMTVRETKTMLEVTNLVVPQLNDNPQLISKLCVWLKNNAGADVPMHFAKFFPNYQMLKHYATPLETLEKAHKIAKDAGLQYVYLDNVGNHDATSTYCPKCRNMLISRTMSGVKITGMKDGQCIKCTQAIQGVW